MASRTTFADFDNRVQEVKQAILQGFTRSNIWAYCAQKWRIKSKRAADKYFNAALTIITEDGKDEIETYRAEQIARLKEIIRTMSPSIWIEKFITDEVTGKTKVIRTPHDTNFRHFLAVIRHLSRITGIETIRIDDPSKMTNDELKDILEDFYEKVNGHS
jgi:hypothetical protein